MRTHFRQIGCGGAPSQSGADTGQRALGPFSAYPRGGRSPRKGPCAAPRISEQGSALLIVLGFLSFMMISAVSFAVYMRIERQASSNYRHATTARHLLNAGLYRAIDDIDAELRVPSISGTVRARKFPDWPGRVKVSAVPNGERNGLDARVLSLEALSFIPGIFVNDVRRYAIPNKLDPKDPSGNTWWGAKWRSISMPGIALSGMDVAQVDVGRYAYVCVNVSDMLDVNLCKADARDCVSNRVSIGNLFANDALRQSFDALYKNTDRHYDTMQDFYACMYKRNDPTFGSPYHEYLKNGTDNDFDFAQNHVLITDSLVKPEPTAAVKPCNILSQTGRPVSAGTLLQTHPATVAMQPEFQLALGSALVGGLPGTSAEMMAAMIADYLDLDGIPKRLNMPSTEMVPMVSQILVPAFFAPKVIKRSVAVPGATPPRNKDVYSVQLISEPTASQLDVELVWPFKNQKDRRPQPGFTVEIQAYLKVIKVHDPKKSQGFMEMPAPATYIPLNGTIAIPDFWSKDTSDPANCYTHVVIPVSTPDPTKLIVDIIDSEDNLVPAADGTTFTKQQPFSVALVVFVNVKAGSDIVDRVPQLAPFLGASDPWDVEFMATPKIFFQTKPSAPVDQTMAAVQIPYEWSSLEVPDPRFNYKAANWIQNTEDVNAIKPKINPSTVALLGQEGRDGDIYMAVSDIGAMQSPGELGFIVRPFLPSPGGQNVDFRNQITVDKSEDKDAMFRTIRVYDHGEPAANANRARDHVYDYFTAISPDGTLPGARVNPLSDIPQVLAAAVVSTPVDYYWAGASQLAVGAPSATTMRNYVFNDSRVMVPSAWAAFTNGWTKCLINATKNVAPALNINTSWKNNLSDLYGNQALFGWYSNGDANKIFDGGYSVSGVPAILAAASPLYEIDRKMLYSFTLDSFSDRQQLFLYIIRAEATVPSFGGTADSGVKSLAGGRAVALVWRDPYPQGYNKANDSWLNKGAKHWNADDRADNGNGARVSPWYQHNIKNYDDTKDDGDEDNTFSQRLDGYHAHRILYFKQLDN